MSGAAASACSPILAAHPAPIPAPLGEAASARSPCTHPCVVDHCQFLYWIIDHTVLVGHAWHTASPYVHTCTDALNYTERFSRLPFSSLLPPGPRFMRVVGTLVQHQIYGKRQQTEAKIELLNCRVGKDHEGHLVQLPAVEASFAQRGAFIINYPVILG